jgi:Pyruvate/2-oxoglutarate dehydrogenase complex, dihydrolipoamide dehydrogenase (E3) component, and related enzymes
VKKHYQLAVVGSGSGGREAAFAAAQNGLKVLLIEKDTLGGTCLHRGCYPIKALRACAEATKDTYLSAKFGIEIAGADTGFEKWLAIQRRVSARLTQELKNQLERGGVEIRFATASFIQAKELCLKMRHDETESIEADYFILATGSRPAFDGVGSYYVNSDQLLTHAWVPRHLLIVGGGYIGCEFAAIFRSLGFRVTLVEKRKYLLADWEQSLGDYIAANLRAAGVEVHLEHELDLPHPNETNSQPVLFLDSKTQIKPDLVLVATGRKPNVEGLGLDGLGIEAKPFVAVDDQLRTTSPQVFAVGDVNGLSLLDSAAVTQARIAVHAILGKKEVFSARWIPKCLHTDPAIGSVGWNEDEAGKAGLDAISHSQTFRLVTEDERTVVTPLPTMVKMLIQAETRQILGVHVVGAQAAEIVNLASLAIRAQFTIDQLLQVPLVHPSATEVFQRCAEGLRRVEVG